MATSPGTEVVTPASPPSTQPQPSYLKSYPYLFVRETDQTDYFCTVCEESLKEEELQSHLFEGHSAENLQDYFVRVNPDKVKGGTPVRTDKPRYLYICVVCWAKLPSDGEMRRHRNTCKVNFGEEQTEDTEEVEGVVSTPDIPTMIEEHNETNGHTVTRNGGTSPAQYFPHPEFIIDTDPSGGMTVHLPKYPETQEVKTSRAGDPVYSSACLQCSLCTMVLPSSSYLSHLRAYHRVSCPLNSAHCPLCMTSVPIMDLTVHLASQHGLVPQSAVNALLLWVLTSNTFALNDSAQASLKAKFKDQTTSPGNGPPPAPRGRPPVPSTQPSRQRAPPPPSSPARPLQPPAPPKTESQAVEPALINDLRAKMPVEQIVGKFTRSHEGPGGKQSHQCLVCSKWYAVPPVKHLRSHIFTFTKERRKALQLASGANICLICYRVFESQQGVAGHVSTHSPDLGTPGLPGGCSSAIPSGGLLAEALLGFPPYSNKQEEKETREERERDDLPLGATFETPGLKPSSPSPSLASSGEVNIELDNAGRVKSGKVRKQCELCGEWSNIKWFFKHMSEVHQALFCRCCREYLPTHEHKEHRQWHSMPPYMGQKIRIEDGQPIIIDRKERASLTPIGSLAAWGGSSGGLVVKAVDEMTRKRKLERLESPNGSVKTSGSSGEGSGAQTGGMLPPDIPVYPPALSLAEDEAGRDSLMPKERCPVCSIEITHKNLARHIKLRHGIKYKFCYKCRKLIPGQMYPEHKALHDSGQLESLPIGAGEKYLEFIDNMTGTEDHDEDETIEIPEEVLDEALDGGNRKDDQFRANTSMNKLESLMGKEFKHPRRKCTICGYSVSYSNFKRHLRNAHPGEVDDSPMEGVEMLMEMELREGMMGHQMEDSDRQDGNSAMEEDNGEIAEGYVECRKCGDVVLADKLGQHTKQIHGEEGIPGLTITPVTKASSPKPKSIIMRACPVCAVEMRSDSIIKHCKIKHKMSYKDCSPCNKYILKKYYKSHVRKHEIGEIEGQVEEDGDLDTSKDGEDEEEKEEDDEEAMDTSTPVKGPSKIYNCVDCTRMFMSADAHANHLRDVHGGEGGSVVLKLPGGEDEEEEDPGEDQLVIDDSQ